MEGGEPEWATNYTLFYMNNKFTFALKGHVIGTRKSKQADSSLVSMTFDELMQLKQDCKIGWCEFALRSEHADEYRQWCRDHDIEPDDDNAELFLEQTEEGLFDDFAPVLA